MELLVFSDSHGSTSGMRHAMELQLHRPAAILHLGDGVREAAAMEEYGVPVYAVRGNCDSFLCDVGVSCPEEQLLCFGEYRVLMTHGASYGVKSGLGGLLTAAVQKKADIVLFGHTHMPHEEILPAGTTVGGSILMRPMYVFNPGSIGRGSRSFGVITLQGRRVLLSHGQL